MSAWGWPVASGDNLPGEIAPLLNYGVLGLAVLAILMGWVWAKPSVDRLLAERDRLLLEKQRAEEQRDVAIAIAQDKLIPLLVTFVDTTQTLIPLLQEIVRDANNDRRR